MATGIKEMINRRKRLEATAAGAASQTILNRGGTLFSPRIRSRHLGRGRSLVAAFDMFNLFLLSTPLVVRVPERISGREGALQVAISLPANRIGTGSGISHSNRAGCSTASAGRRTSAKIDSAART